MSLVDDYLGNEHTTGKLPINVTTTGKLERPYDEDWFAVTLEAGVTYYLNLSNRGPTDTANMVLGFFDPRLDRIVSAISGRYDGEFALEFTPTVSGSYFAVAAEMAGNLVEASYALRLTQRTLPDDFSSNTQTKGVLTVGTAVRGVFEQRGDVDWLKFHAEKGYSYVFSVEGAELYEPGRGLVSSMTIMDGQGHYLQSGLLAFSPLQTGDYYVALNSFRDGYYGVQAKQWRDDLPARAGTDGLLTSGGTVQSSTDFQSDTDWLRIPIEQGKIYTVSLQTDAPWAVKSSIVDADGNYFSTFAGPGNSLSFQATTTGSAFAIISHSPLSINDNQVYPYAVSLAVQDAAVDADASAPVTLAVGSTVQGILQLDDMQDTFKLRLDGGTSYQFDFTSNTQANFLGLRMASADDSSKLLDFADVRDGKGLYYFTPIRSGDYLFSVHGRSQIWPSISYALATSQAPDDWAANRAGAGNLQVGGSVQGQLDNSADRDWFAVQLEAGKTYWFTPSSPNSDMLNGAQLRLVDAADNTILSYNISAGTGPLAFTPTSSATYYAEFSSRIQMTGRYALSAALGLPDDNGNSVASATALALGKTVQGKLEVPSDEDFFRFDALAGRTYIIHSSALVDYTVGIHFYDRSGKQIEQPDAAYYRDLAYYVAQSDGPVYVKVQGAAASNYQFVLDSVLDDNVDRQNVNARKLGEGDSVNGVFEHGHDLDVFAMRLDANRNYVLKITNLTPGGAAPSLDFLGNRPINSEQTVAGIERTVKLSTQSAGDYYLQLGSGNFSAAPYRISVLPFEGDGNGPSLVAQSIAAQATNVALTERLITLKFSEPVVLDRQGLALRDSSGATIRMAYADGVYYPSLKGDTLTLKTADFLAPGNYTISIPAESVHDLNGNRYTGPQIISFSTITPASAPGTGNDLYVGKTGAVIDGGPGVDTLWVGTYSGFSFVSPDGPDFIVRNMLDPKINIKIHDIERLMFLDQIYALDIDGNAGQAYRLYQAAFNRAPDMAGLAYWIGQLDHGAKLVNVAQDFVDSSEFASLYGSPISDSWFVQTLYRNVLHRPADGAGYDYWMDALHHGASRADLLVQFSESNENQAALIDIIGGGFPFLRTNFT